MTDPVATVLDALDRMGLDPRPSTNGSHRSRCPGHEDRNPSLSVGTGEDGRALVKCFAGCSTEAIVSGLGLRMADLYPEADRPTNGKPHANSNGKSAGTTYPSVEDAAEMAARMTPKGPWRHTDTWHYRDATGDSEVFAVARIDSEAAKQFRPIRKTPEGWSLGDPEGTLPLYRLHELAGLSRVYVVEGEGCASIVEHTLGLVSTTSAHGAKSAHKSDWSPLAGREVIIMPDNDQPGEGYAGAVMAILAKITPKPTVRIVRLPGLPVGGDVIDWLAANPQMTKAQARAELERMADAAPKIVFDAGQGGEADDSEPWLPLRLGAMPIVEGFPVEVLPPPVADLVREVSRSIGCPPDFVGLPALIVSGAAIGRSVSLRLKAGYFASASLYGMNVGGPSSGKSPALDAVVRPLWKIDEDLHDAYKAERSAYDVEIARLDKMVKADRPPPPARPTIRTAMLDDSTVETIADHLALNPRGLMVSKDEGSALVASFNQYKGGKGTDRQFWLSALFGKPIRVDRKKNVDLVPIRVPHPFLSVVGNLTPDMLGELREPSGRSDGFIERILFACPDPRPRPLWTEDGIPDDVVKTWAQLVGRLRDRPLASTDGKDHPHPVSMADDAKARWRAFYDAHVEETNSPEYDAGDLAAEGKLVDFAARFSLILHMLDLASDPTRGDIVDIPPVSIRAVDGAIRLWHYFRSHYKRARALMQGRGAGGAPRGAQLVLNWIRNHPDRLRFSFGDITKTYPHARGYDPAMLHDGIQWLDQRKAIRPLAAEKGRPQGIAGRKPTLAWEVRPDLIRALDNQGNQGFGKQTPKPIACAPPDNPDLIDSLTPPIKVSGGDEGAASPENPDSSPTSGEEEAQWEG